MPPGSLTTPVFQPGDRVLHSGKPQWGVGKVERADRVIHEGQQAQRLVVTFPNHGRVTLNTAFAPLKPAGSAPEPRENQEPMPNPTAPALAPVSAHLGALKALPEAATDPLSSSAARLGATLALYRYSTEPRSLLDWAVAQTRLDDPLSHFTRHELEQAFGAFSLNRDRHLKSLALALRKAGKQELLHEAARTLTGPARDAAVSALRGL